MSRRSLAAGCAAGLTGVLVAGLAMTDLFSSFARPPGEAVLRAPQFTAEEIARILQHGPWPMQWQPDVSNRVSGRPQAIDFGRVLFFEPRLSGTGTASCASCHIPQRAFGDGKPLGEGFATLNRNTTSLLNVRHNRWFGWDGAADSLWAQSMRPLLERREMAASTSHVGALLRGDPRLAALYIEAFREAPAVDDDAATVNAGKALAAFQETLVSARTAFDDFRDALARGDRAATDRYPAAAQRGLRIFVGKGNCFVCHFGPNFTNGEFADIGIPFFIAPGRVDPGRHEGIRRLLDSRANLLGKFNDDTTRSTATGTRHIVLEHRNWGEFKVPSLREIARTAPYMHNGSLRTLADVVRHYSELDEERLHADGERILKPLRLTQGEAADLVAFLESLGQRP